MEEQIASNHPSAKRDWILSTQGKQVEILTGCIIKIAKALDINTINAKTAGDALLLVDDIIQEIVSRSNADYNTQELYEGG